MPAVIVGISDCKLCADMESSLVTYALGSCIAVAAYDPAMSLGGMLHYMLPEATLDANKAKENPFMFADTGIPALLRGLASRGANLRRLTVYLIGGAQVVSGHELFQIGKRNHQAARKLLWKAGVLVAAEAVGGEVSRTVRMEVRTGRLYIREAGGADCELVRRGGLKGN